MSYFTENFEPSDALTLEDIVFLQNLASEAGYDSAQVLIGPQIPTGTVDRVNKIFVFTYEPKFIIVDSSRSMVKTMKNGQANWTGTTTVTLSIAPNEDIFGF